MAENKVSKKLFTETLRPKTLDELITFPRVKEPFRNGLQGNYLFCGKQGTGKTSICRILAKDYDTLTINCSLERGIDTIRDTISKFCTSTSLIDMEDGTAQRKMKIVLLEEFDNMSRDAQLSLRAFIEKHTATTRFLANCNMPDAIFGAIRSRFNVVYMEPQTDDEEAFLRNAYCERVKQLLPVLKIKFTDEKVLKLINRFFPDFRSVITAIQNMYTRGCDEIPDDVASDGSDLTGLFSIIFSSQPDPWENYKKLQLDWQAKADLAILEIGKQFPDYLNKNFPQNINKLPMSIIAIAEHQAMLSQSADFFVVLLSLVYKLQLILNGK